MFKTVVIAVALLSLYSCKKKELMVSKTDEPDFYLKGAKNNADFLLIAGDNGYYMYTDFTRDDSNVTAYKGILSKGNCSTPSCYGALSLILRGTKQYNSDAIPDITQEIVLKEYRFGLRDPKPLRRMRLSAEPSYFSKAGTYTYEWSFGDGQNATGDAPEVLFAHSTKSVSVCLNITGGDCSSHLCFDALTDKCSAEINVIPQGNSIQLQGVYKGNSGAIKYVWIFEDGRRVAGKSLAWVPESGINQAKVCLEITDENDCVSRICRTVVVHKDSVECAPAFNYQTSILQPVFGMLQLQTAEIIYTDENGVTFSTALSPTPGVEVLKILEIHDYKKSETGNPVKRLRISFTAVLTSATGAQIQFTQMEGYIGIAFQGG